MVSEVMKTMIIAGAGKGLGLSVAKRFGKEGFQIGLVARNTEKLQSMTEELRDNGIEASYYIADLREKQQVEKAVNGIKAKYGGIDVMEFSPGGNMMAAMAVTPLEVTDENAREYFDIQVVSAINVVNSVVPDMVKRGEGALLFTCGLSALYPIPMLANVGISTAGLHNYIANLHAALSPKGILVANRILGVLIKAGTGAANDPDVIADMWFRVYTEKQDGDEEYPKGVTPETCVV
jgi:short-subunit dehydrogenase